MLSAIIGFAGSWLIKGLLRIGVSEGTAGLVAGSRVFAPIVTVIVVVGGLLLGWGAFKVGGAIESSGRARELAVAESRGHAKAVADVEIAHLKAEVAALRQAAEKSQSIASETAARLRAADEANQALRTQNEELAAAGRNPDALVIDADDPWLRAVRPGAAGAGKGAGAVRR
jgi:hypothetical protein